MKKITLILILSLFFLNLKAQEEYSYQIVSENGDSTFQIEVLTQINPTQFTIKRTLGLDSIALQNLQYARIIREYNELARMERNIDNSRRQIAVLLNSLASVGLNNYNADQIVRLDSLFVTDKAVWRSRSVASVPSFVLYREGNTSIVRRSSDNANIAAIIPRSPRFIILNILAAEYQIGGDTTVEMSSFDGRLFVGQGASGERYILSINRQ